MPLVSIIVPVYNTSVYLSKCIESILSQSFKDLELFLVDDGSTDGSGSICDEFAKEDSRVKVIHKDNGGVSSARNAGLDVATGEWIAFVDADDILFPGALRRMYSQTSDVIDLVINGFTEITDKEATNSQINSKAKVIDRDDALLLMYPSAKNPYLGYSWGKLYKKGVIDRGHIRFDEMILFKEDTLFVVDYICHSTNSIILDLFPVYGYHINREDSAMTSMVQSFSNKYLTSFDSVVKMWRLISGIRDKGKLLTKTAKYEIVNRVYLIYGHMLDHNAFDRKKLSSIRGTAIREVGIFYFIEFQYHRFLRKIISHYNRGQKNV